MQESVTSSKEKATRDTHSHVCKCMVNAWLKVISTRKREIRTWILISRNNR